MGKYDQFDDQLNTKQDFDIAEKSGEVFEVIIFIQILLILLKITKSIDCNWLWVLSPILGTVGIALAMFIIVLVASIINYIRESYNQRKER